MNKPEKSKVKGVTLRQHMASHPEGIGIQDAVALLLGVALQLRDMHNDGFAHLQISPDSVFVGSGGALLRGATTSETDRYTSGYAAPEIYKGTSAGNLSDIYSFCAVLSFAASGKHPANALARAESAAVEAAVFADSAFGQIMQTGMAPDAAERFASMQELILKLSAYNVRPFVNQAAKKKTGSAARAALPQVKIPKVKFPQIKLPQISLPKSRVRPQKLVAIVAAVLVIATAVAYIACYNIAKTKAEAGDYVAAEKLLFAPAITKLHDAELMPYMEALRLLDDGSYAQAQDVFTALPGYLDADTFVLEADYRLALEYARNHDFENAFRIMGQLQAKNYRDADYKMCEFYYSYGICLLQEQQDYDGAYTAFSMAAALNYTGAEEMKQETIYLEAGAMIGEEDFLGAYQKLTEIEGYRDVDSALETLEETIYQLGQRYYRSGDYDQAETYFLNVPYYRDSLQYRQLISAREETKRSGFGSYMLGRTVENLIDMFYFEDTAQVLLSNDAVAEKFLQGTWKGDGYYFIMDEEDGISYNLPRIDYGDYYKISDGLVLLYPEGSETRTVPLFFIEATSPDSIYVLCYKNERSYMLDRQ